MNIPDNRISLNFEIVDDVNPANIPKSNINIPIPNIES
jgi:hypothetical protein